MAQIQFLDSLQKEEVEVSILNEHVIEIKGAMTNTSGFIAFSSKGKQIGDFSDYTTLFRLLDDGFQLSNDGSVYVAPEPIPEIELTLDDIKEQKITELNAQQQMIIANGCDVTLNDGTETHFTLTQEDQSSLNSLSVKVLEGLTAIPWHSSDEDKGCIFYSKEDMKTITDTCASFVTWHVTWFRDLRRYVRSLTDKESVKSVTYYSSIPEKYQSEVLKTLMLQNGEA